MNCYCITIPQTTTRQAFYNLMRLYLILLSMLSSWQGLSVGAVFNDNCLFILLLRFDFFPQFTRLKIFLNMYFTWSYFFSFHWFCHKSSIWLRISIFKQRLVITLLIYAITLWIKEQILTHFLELHLMHSIFSKIVFCKIARPSHDGNPQTFNNTAENLKKNIISRLFKRSK